MYGALFVFGGGVRKMKSIRYIVLLLCIIFLFCSCGKKQNIQQIIPEENKETHTEQQEVQQQKPKHSELYNEKYNVEDVIMYFNEVVLNTEYSTGTGDNKLVQRWDVPISYRFVGEYTDEDKLILEELFAELNAIYGFPGVSQTEEAEEPNLYIYFEGREELNDRFLDFLQGEYVDGVARYWYYDDTNDIHTGSIGYWKDMERDVRKSVLLEEVINCLGLGDTDLRQDSIVYQYGSENTDLSEMDWLILKLMYHPRIRCGMGVAECEEIIRELYY